jgi:hypothetical protein
LVRRTVSLRWPDNPPSPPLPPVTWCVPLGSKSFVTECYKTSRGVNGPVFLPSDRPPEGPI